MAKVRVLAIIEFDTKGEPVEETFEKLIREFLQSNVGEIHVNAIEPAFFYDLAEFAPDIITLKTGTQDASVPHLDVDDDEEEEEDFGLSDSDRDAAQDATGYDSDTMSDDQIALYMFNNANKPLYVMESELADKEKIFEYNGGRGVELADEIDSLRVAIAIRKARNET